MKIITYMQNGYTRVIDNGWVKDDKIYCAECGKEVQMSGMLDGIGCYGRILKCANGHTQRIIWHYPNCYPEPKILKKNYKIEIPVSLQHSFA